MVDDEKEPTPSVDKPDPNLQSVDTRGPSWDAPDPRLGSRVTESKNPKE